VNADYMRGVAVDCTNKPPTWRKLRNAGLYSVRIEMRDLPSFYTYTQELSKHHIEQAWLVGPLTGELESILDKAVVRPSLVIIGNEPDAVGDSSWTMDLADYIHLWTRSATLIRDKWPTVELATAGMYSRDYLQTVYRYLQPKPIYANRHYPNTVSDIQEFDRVGSGRTIVGEWTWRGATQKQMYDWENMLEYFTWASFWFCWADYMVPGHGLLTQTGEFTKAYRHLKAVLTKRYKG
jgi:hypothetical protein